MDLSEEPFAIGSEHEVWHVGDKVIKLTYPDFFGLKVVYRGDEDHRCSPCEYFERWVLHNELFGDDVEILGKWGQKMGSGSELFGMLDAPEVIMREMSPGFTIRALIQRRFSGVASPKA